MATADRTERRRPLLSAGVVVVVAAFSVAGSLFPELVDAMQRQPSMLAGEWWRFVTALFIQPDEAWKAAVVLGLFLLVAAIAELGHPRAAWIAAFAAGGLAGEIAGIFWQPVGAGVSVGGCGLLGLVLAGLLCDRRRPLPERLVWPAFGFAAAIGLCALKDIHGPPILAGAAAGMLAQPSILDPRRH